MGEYFERKWAYYDRNRGGLPSGFRRVEYIDCSGAQYIDTGVNGGSDIVVSCEIYAPATSGVAWGCIQQEVVSANTTRCQLQIAHTNTSTVQYFADTDTNAIGFKITLPIRNTMLIDNVNGVFRVGNETKTRAVATYSMDTSIFVFARNILRSTGVYDVGSFCNGVRAYSMEISKGGVLARNLVPCVRVADSKPGMYDLCGSICPLTNSPFYVNAGSGADFTWGELS